MKFIQEHSDGTRIEMELGPHNTWPDVADHFFHFLLACGYSLDRGALSMHFYEEDEYRGADAD